MRRWGTVRQLSIFNQCGSDSYSRLDQLGLWQLCRPAHYEFVDERFERVHSRLDQDLMFTRVPGWTGVDGMQLQPRVQPLEPHRDLPGHPGAPGRSQSMRRYKTNPTQSYILYMMTDNRGADSRAGLEPITLRFEMGRVVHRGVAGIQPGQQPSPRQRALPNHQCNAAAKWVVPTPLTMLIFDSAVPRYF